MTPSAHGLVDAAQRLLDPSTGPAGSLTPGLRSRAAAVLLRMALERGLDAFWRGVAPGMTRIGKHRMLCLERYTSRAVGRQWRTTWTALSAACHYHTYELPPTPAEMRARLGEVRDLLRALPATAVPRPGGAPGHRGQPFSAAAKPGPPTGPRPTAGT
ncbi:hypothetical protein [Streptomyces litchfieldiae]|uniref:DUF4129 domain-containing protein n=1 Tax=Streptomyces litchfieldiae TaxID=3075543 RepID=A0ABU2MQ36_9ACTN|nr:hypothetical protein [Streptomyces sp. DSM 44938]MDT0343512.1 hypothetical protein [Streptomyces sp. DSM 44938]